jgi:prepilin-type processing-associated H-X9-DG protein
MTTGNTLALPRIGGQGVRPSSPLHTSPVHQFEARPGYNVLFCDGHVSLISRLDFIDPRKTARNWNNDNEPHPETWIVEKYPYDVDF